MNKRTFILCAMALLPVFSTLQAKDKQPRQRNGQQYSLEQAISDRAQLHTIGFSGVAFLTGEYGASTFIPPGKVCDFFGFQYMRDIDAAKKGHNPVFLNRVAGNVLHVLNDEQKKLFADLAQEQSPQLEALAKMRLPLIKAFHMELERKEPGLKQQAVTNYVGNIFEYDAELSIRRAEVMAQVYKSLTEEQKAYFAEMKFGDFNTWPDIDERGKKRNEQGKGKRKGSSDRKSKLFNVAYMTYASEFFSWTAGNMEADVYFCPERHGTYFGGFYMKDMPAMGKRDYDISTSVTGDSGRDLIEKILRPEQAKKIINILEKQRSSLHEIVSIRRDIASELRVFLTGQSPDSKQLKALGRRYGELDGHLSWLYTMAFAEVNRTLTDDQREDLVKLRNLTGYDCAPYYIYSRGREEALQFSNVEKTFFEN